MTETVTFEQQVIREAEGAPAPEAPAVEPAEPVVAAEDKIPASVQAEPKSEAKSPEPPKEPEKKPVETVPLAVHIRQRERFDSQINELRQQLAVGNERLQKLMESLQPTQPAIDRATDPLGATLQELDAVKQETKATRELIQQEREAYQRNEQIAQLNRWVAQDEQSYAQQAPDLKDAITYIRDMKFREYVALGIDPTQAAAKVTQDGYALSMHAYQNGLSPSELAYRAAVALGYQKRPAPIAESQPGTLTAPVKTQAEQAVEMRAAGAARTSKDGGAGASGGAMSFAELAALPNDEFLKLTKGKNWQKLLGQ